MLLRPLLILAKNSLMVSAAPAKPARSPCSKMLPVAGSKYAKASWLNKTRHKTVANDPCTGAAAILQAGDMQGILPPARGLCQ